MSMRNVKLVLGVLLVLVAGAAFATPNPDGAIVMERVWNDCPASTLTVNNTYPMEIFIQDVGLNCYGCCEPLHNKMHLMRTIPNIRKVSMSPWVNLDQASERMGKDMVFSAKPNPAVLAMDHWDPKFARDDLRKICDKTRNNVVEIILKDITTVRRQPQRLWEWAEIAMQVAQEYP